MKIANKILSSFVMVVLLASCAEKQLPDSAVIPVGQSDAVVPTRIVATFEEATKVTYTEIAAESVFNLRPQWEVGDEIIALDGNGVYYVFKVETVNEDKSAVLSGQAPTNCQLHLIFCPGFSDITRLAVDYTAQTGAKTTMPAVMFSDGEIQGGTGTFHFRNAGGIVGIWAVNGIPEGTKISKITVSGENLSAAGINLSENALTLNVSENPIDAISVDGLNLTVEDANGTLSNPVFLAVPAGAKIAKVSVPLAKDAETMKKPSATPQEGVDYVTIDGIKWAIWNIGASSETDYGWYFAWGGTEGYYSYENTWQSVKSTSFESAYSPESAYTVDAKDYVYVKTQTFAITGHSFNWANTPYHTGGDSFTGWTKYIPAGKSSYWYGGGSPDNKLTLDPVDDVARVNWGGNWRMPKTEEINRLNKNTTSEWIVDYKGTGINGRLFTSKVAGEEGHSIFIPAAGYGTSGPGHEGSIGNYWAKDVFSATPSDAYGLFTNASGSKTDGTQRYHGFPVRPVLESESSSPASLTFRAYNNGGAR